MWSIPLPGVRSTTPPASPDPITGRLNPPAPPSLPLCRPQIAQAVVRLARWEGDPKAFRWTEAIQPALLGLLRLAAPSDPQPTAPDRWQRPDSPHE